ncbi:hypothetical protein RLIN73S_02092 [Rhodanobacter lindaniclasticus]
MRWISPHRDRVDAGERFVQQHVARVGGQCAGDFHAAALAAGQAGALLAGDVGDLQLVQQAFQLALSRCCELRPLRNSSTAMMLSATLSRRNTEASCGR